jgi:hypothetical protein
MVATEAQPSGHDLAFWFSIDFAGVSNQFARS